MSSGSANLNDVLTLLKTYEDKIKDKAKLTNLLHQFLLLSSNSTASSTQAWDNIVKYQNELLEQTKQLADTVNGTLSKTNNNDFSEILTRLSQINPTKFNSNLNKLTKTFKNLDPKVIGPLRTIFQKIEVQMARDSTNISELKGSLDNVNLEVEKYQHQNRTLQDEISRQKKSISFLETQLITPKLDIGKLQRIHAQNLVSTDMDNVKLEAELNNAYQEINNLKTRLQVYTSDDSKSDQILRQQPRTYKTPSTIQYASLPPIYTPYTKPDLSGTSGTPNQTPVLVTNPNQAPIPFPNTNSPQNQRGSGNNPSSSSSSSIPQNTTGPAFVLNKIPINDQKIQNLFQLKDINDPIPITNITQDSIETIATSVTDNESQWDSIVERWNTYNLILSPQTFYVTSKPDEKLAQSSKFLKWLDQDLESKNDILLMTINGTPIYLSWYLKVVLNAIVQGWHKDSIKFDKVLNIDYLDPSYLSKVIDDRDSFSIFSKLSITKEPKQVAANVIVCFVVIPYILLRRLRLPDDENDTIPSQQRPNSSTFWKFASKHNELSIIQDLKKIDYRALLKTNPMNSKHDVFLLNLESLHYFGKPFVSLDRENKPAVPVDIVNYKVQDEGEDAIKQNQSDIDRKTIEISNYYLKCMNQMLKLCLRPQTVSDIPISKQKSEIERKCFYYSRVLGILFGGKNGHYMGDILGTLIGNIKHNEYLIKEIAEKELEYYMLATMLITASFSYMNPSSLYYTKYDPITYNDDIATLSKTPFLKEIAENKKIGASHWHNHLIALCMKYREQMISGTKAEKYKMYFYLFYKNYTITSQVSLVMESIDDITQDIAFPIESNPIQDEDYKQFPPLHLIFNALSVDSTSMALKSKMYHLRTLNQMKYNLDYFLWYMLLFKFHEYGHIVEIYYYYNSKSGSPKQYLSYMSWVSLNLNPRLVHIYKNSIEETNKEIQKSILKMFGIDETVADTMMTTLHLNGRWEKLSSILINGWLAFRLFQNNWIAPISNLINQSLQVRESKDKDASVPPEFNKLFETKMKMTQSGHIVTFLNLTNGILKCLIQLFNSSVNMMKEKISMTASLQHAILDHIYVYKKQLPVESMKEYSKKIKNMEKNLESDLVKNSVDTSFVSQSFIYTPYVRLINRLMNSIQCEMTNESSNMIINNIIQYFENTFLKHGSGGNISHYDVCKLIESH